MKKISLICFLLLAFALPYGYATDWANPDSVIVKDLYLKDATMQELSKLILMQYDVPIVVSREAQKEKVTCQFKKVPLLNVLDAITRSNGMWCRLDPRTGIIHIETLMEFKKSLRLGGSERVEVIQIMYPNANDIGETVSQLFASKVVWNRSDETSTGNYQRIQAALSRMDILATRGSIQPNLDQGSSGGNGSNSGYSSYGSGYSSSYGSGSSYGGIGTGFGSGGLGFTQNFSSMYGPRHNNNNGAATYSAKTEVDRMAIEQLASIVHELDKANSKIYQEITSNPGVVYMTAMNENNKLMLRSADPIALEQMTEVIRKLDTPAPQVLLEVKVLEITLDDTREHSIDFLFGNDDIQGGFSNEPIALKSSQNNALATPFDNRQAVFSTISENFSMKMKFLDRDNRVTALATPNLLVSDNEASNLFIGKEMTILQKAQPSSAVLQGTTGSLAGVGGTEIDAPRMRVGTTLLLTPKIHPDRSVTLRVMQEQSYPAEQPRRIVYQGSTGGTITDTDGNTTSTSGTQQYFESTDIDLQTITTTVIAQDQNLIVIGGLIRESVSKQLDKIPVFGDIPYIGELLFSRLDASRKRTELIILIRPFVLQVPGEGQTVTRTFLERMSQHPSAIGNIPSLGVNNPEEIAKPHHVNPDDPWFLQAYDKLRVWSVDDDTPPVIERAADEYQTDKRRRLTDEELKRIRIKQENLNTLEDVEGEE